MASLAPAAGETELRYGVTIRIVHKDTSVVGILWKEEAETKVSVPEESVYADFLLTSTLGGESLSVCAAISIENLKNEDLDTKPAERIILNRR